MTSREPLLPRETLELSPVRGLATAVTVLVGATCVASVFSTWTDWSRYQTGRDYLADVPGMTDQDLSDADDLAVTGGVLYGAVLVATAIVVIVWLWRARRNAEWLHDAEHRLTRGWVAGSWFVPVISLWFPYQVVDDIWRTSDPAAPHDAVITRQLPSGRLVARWWFAWVASSVVGLVPLFDRAEDVTIESFRQLAVVDTISTALECVAGVLLILVVRQITAWHTMPRTYPPARRY
jgi:uncharacterized protein DUF4328